MRHAFPSFQPDPFGSGHVDESAVDRAVTDFEVVSSLLFGQLFRRIERETVGVIGVIEESAYVFNVHSLSFLARATAIAPATRALFFNSAMFTPSARPPVFSATLESRKGVTSRPVTPSCAASFRVSSIAP